jgi:pro-kumamolisin-like protein/Big-like domain-containing protein
MKVLSFASKRLLSVTSLAVILSCVSLAQQVSVSPQVAPHPLITQPIDEGQLTVLKGNTHVLARPQFDLGTAPATLPMQRMLLVLKRSPEQESTLRQLLDEQQDKHSPNYHRWLTPEQFGKEFGPTDADMQIITSWLQSHGFQVGTSKGRTVLEFSGSASQVKEAFHTTIHKYIVNGEQHWANASDPSIPTALTPAVAGVLTLHNFVKRPHIRVSKEKVSAKVRPGKSPTLTFTDGSHGMAPADFGKIYNSPFNYSTPTTNTGTTGAGVTIGVIGRSNLYSVDSPAEDITDFRSSSVFNLPLGSFNIILNGPDPGDLGGTEELEATLDSSWSGAVAPAANVDFVVSATTNTTDGVDLSEVYIIENNLADVMTESFGICEAENTGEQPGVSALAEQAAAQGITYFVSTGDTGAEGCDDNSETVATGPVSVSLTASTPFNVAVGGTVFNDSADPTKYWSATNTNQESAISYIPEDVWNDSCLASSCGSSASIAAGGGGSSIFPGKPSWQTGVTGILADGTRDLPDVSLSAAPHDGYVLCVEASCAQSEASFAVVGGTSASTPSFAGIMALVEANPLLTAPSQNPRQGLANYVFYRLAAAETAYPAQCNGSSTATSPLSTCIFHDVTVGNNAVPGEINYGLASAQYQAGAGYDMTTGLGSVNITNLVNQWSSVTFNATTTTLALTPTPTTITHGTAVTVNITVAPSSGTGTPTGDVSLVAATGPSVSKQTGVGFFTLSSGTVTGASTTELPGGSYTVSARYAGDGTFAPSDSSPGVAVTVSPESSTTTLSEFTQDSNGNTITLANGTSLPFGSLVFVRADVVGKSAAGVPTGQVTFTDNGSTKLPGPIFNPVANPAALNSEGNTSIGAGIFNFDGGNHSISASYAGDNSFNASSSTQPVTFSIQPGFTGVSGLANVTIASPGGSGTTTIGIIASSNFTTAVSFACTGLPSEASCGTPSATGKGPNTTVTTTITVTTTAPHTTMLPHNQRRYYFAAIVGGGLPLAGIFLLATPRRRRRSMLLGLMLVMALLLTLPACGGGGSSTPPPTQDPGTPAGTYTVTVTATGGSLSQQEGTFTLTLQ